MGCVIERRMPAGIRYFSSEETCPKARPYKNLF